MVIRNTNLHASNSIQALFALLKESLINSEAGEKALRKRLILVPSEEKKSWVIQRLAEEDISILNIDVMALSDFFSFNRTGPGILSWRGALFSSLASLFQRRQFSAEESWMLAEHHEYAIATRLFKGGVSAGLLAFEDAGDRDLWSGLEALIPEICSPEAFNSAGSFSKNISYESIFVFGISSISAPFLGKIADLSTTVQAPVSFYTISPCLHFWSDEKSSAEIQKFLDCIQRQGSSQEHFFEYELALSQRNELLANLGVLAREFSRYIEERSFHLAPSYSMNKELMDNSVYRDLIIPEYIGALTGDPVCLLEYLKTDILLFTNTRKLQQAIALGDRSFSGAVCATRYLEVESLYAAILQQRSSEQVSSGDIIVLVPSIPDYEDAFAQIFHQDQPLAIQYWNRSRVVHNRNSLFGWIEALFDFVGSREAGVCRNSESALRALCTQVKTAGALFLGLEEEDPATALFQLLERLNPDWYISKEHLKRELASRGIAAIHTIKTRDFQSIKNLFVETITGQAPAGRAIDSFQDADPDLYNLILPLIDFLEQIDQIWNIPLRADSAASISEWVEKIEATLPACQGLEDTLSQEEAALFETVCYRFKEMAARLGSTQVSFSWFAKTFLDECISLASSTHPEPFLGHVIIAEKGRFDFVPCQGVAILGASPDQFPEKSREHFFSHLEMLAPTMPNDHSAIDKELFLEGVLAARSWVYVSVVEKEEMPNMLFAFSPTIRECISYVRRNFIFEIGEDIAHVLFKRAVHVKQPPSRLPMTADISAGVKEAEPGQLHHISVHELLSTGSDPIGTFLQSAFHIHPQSAYRLFRDPGGLQTRLKPSRRAHAEAIRSILHKTPTQVMEGKSWPKGYLGSLSCDLAQKKAEEISKAHALSLPMPMVLFDHEYERLDPDPNTYFGQSIVLKNGVISGAWNQESHFLLISDSWKIELFSRFPAYLMYAFLSLKQRGRAPEIIFGRLTGRLPIVSDAAEAEALLESWIHFVSQAKGSFFPYTFSVVEELVSTPCPLPDAEALDETVDRFHALIQQEKLKFSPLNFISHSCSHSEIRAAFQVWHEWACKLYGPLFSWIDQKPFEEELK